jgi:Mg-chelatase subunit ChlD
MVHIVFIFLFLLLSPLNAVADITLTAPSEVTIGTKIQITVNGSPTEVRARDYVTIVKQDAKDKTLGNRASIKDGQSTLKVDVPEFPGEYEIRYVSYSDRKVFARTPLIIKDAPTSINAPKTTSAGSKIKVAWTGPNNPRDLITIVPVDTNEGKHQNYTYTSRGNNLELQAPDVPGAYEIRYLSAQKRRTLTRTPITVTAVSASLEAPTELKAGSSFKVIFEGPQKNKEFITIVPSDLEERAYKKYQYASRAKTDRNQKQYLKFTAPETPGEYEIRYLSGQKYLTLARHPINVTSVEASLSIPNSVKAGTDVVISWTGPDNDRDFITIVKKGTEERKYGTYKYTNRSKDNKLKLKAPEVAGEYEVRYLSGQKYFTLASHPLRVTNVRANLEAPTQVMAGSVFDIAWQGPDNDRDFITIVPEGAEERSYKDYVYTRKKLKTATGEENVVRLTAPEVAGKYELRYLTGRKYFTITSRPIEVTPVTASITAPEETVANEPVAVSWEGPGNAQDYITIVPASESLTKYGPYAYVRRGKNLRILAPVKPGNYEFRYVTGRKNFVLATKAVTVVPSRVPGTIQVTTLEHQTKTLAPDTAVAVILDASGSMLQKIEGKRRIEVAKRAVTDFTKEALPAGTPFSLRVFGHKEADSCRTDLEIPLAPLQQKRVAQKISSINAKNLAKTPIARSLELIKQDLASTKNGKRIIVLVTDGEETCDGDPAEAIKQLAASGFDTRVNIIGFAIDELMLKETFAQWAQLGNGRYFDAKNAAELTKSIAEAVEVPFEVTDAKNNIIATGVVNGAPIEVLPGTYTVNVLSEPKKSFEQVQVSPKKLNKLAL